MEESPSLWQRIAHAPTAEATHSSHLQRMMRTLLAPILLGSAVAMSVPPAVEAKDPVKETQKTEDPKLAALRIEILRLIPDLDSNKYRIREQAQKRLWQIVVEWVTTKREPCPLVSLLQPKKDTHSLEQQRRLERVIEVHEKEAVELLWLPTMFQEPAEWKNRKVPLKISDVLLELGRQTGQDFSMYINAEWPVRGMSGRTFWGILEELQKGIEQPLDIGRFGDDALRVIHPDWENWKRCCSKIASQGSVGAHFFIDPVARRAWLTIDAEPKLRVGKYRIVEVVGKTDTGVPFEPYEPVMGGGYQGDTGRTPCVAIPHVPGAKTADIRFTMEVEAYRPKTVPIVDLKKEQRIKSSALAFEYLKTTRGTTERTWQIHGRTKVGWQGKELFSFVRCKAFDAKNQPIRWYGSGSQSDNFGSLEYSWEFCGEPHRIEYSVPERSTTRTLTFMFPGMPIPQ